MKKMNKKRKLIISTLVVLLSFMSITNVSAAPASTFYEGKNTNRAKCVLQDKMTPKQIKDFADTAEYHGIRLGAMAAVSALIPIIGSYYASFVGLAAADAALTNYQFRKKGEAGYSAYKYNCVKVNWDGYSSLSYIKYIFG